MEKSDGLKAASPRVCVHCVMDTTDPEISFDESGRCCHCRQAESLLKMAPYALPPEEKEACRRALVDRIRRTGRGKNYDCVIGVSGGVDSTYVAHLLKDAGLRALAVHLDNGWNSKLAVTNIENVLKRMGIELFTHVIEWNEFKDLQLAFLKASTPDSEIPTDHAIFSLLYKTAARERVSFILGGTNLATESILPRRWSFGHADWRYIKGVHARFGKVPLRTFPHRTMLEDFYLRKVRSIRWVNYLDYHRYVQEDARRALQRDAGWESYGGKHCESIYTRFYQRHILPAKFGFDKRKAHLSSLIVSGQMTRAQALEELKAPLYDPAELKEDLAYFINKLDLTEAQYREIMALPLRRFDDYPSYERDAPFRWALKAYRSWKRFRHGGGPE
jgi:N-acetyl sugar amidotransferase